MSQEITGTTCLALLYTQTPLKDIKPNKKQYIYSIDITRPAYENISPITKWLRDSKFMYSGDYVYKIIFDMEQNNIVIRVETNSKELITTLCLTWE